MDIQKAKEHLTGPVMSLRVGYDKDGGIDYQAVRNVIDLSVAGGGRTVMLTAGDSHYDSLSGDEITELTRVAVEHTAGRAMVIAADRCYATNRAVRFASHCKQLGADMYMAQPPDWAHSTTAETLAEHYAAIAEIMPVMVVTNRFIPRGIPFGLETLTRTFDLSKNVVAIKDDMCGTFAQDICTRFKDRCAIIAGGQKRNHLNMHLYGCDGYLSTFAMYNPRIARSYWDAIKAGDLQAAGRIVAEKDVPFYDHIAGVKGGFDAAMHGMLELYGLGKRYRRKPYHTISDDDLEMLRQFLLEKELLDERKT